MPNLDTLADRLSYVIALAEVGLQEVDRLAGLSSSGHTGQIARGGKTHLQATTATALARVFGTSAEWLVDGRGSAPSERSVRRAVREARRGHAYDRTSSTAPAKRRARAGGKRAAKVAA